MTYLYTGALLDPIYHKVSTGVSWEGGWMAQGRDALKPSTTSTWDVSGSEK